METIKNSINWFEIPVTDFGRAKEFYSKIYDFDMPVQEMGHITMGFFPQEQGVGVGGSICKGEGYEPSAKGALVYLNGGEDLTEVLDRVEGAGGKIAVPKTQITPEIGYFAILVDTEGNRVALHSMK
ncbi:MAG: VOC family protein [Candidatus Krumholzibacteria bacterium]